MIYPATLDLEVLQDSTFDQDFIITDAVKIATLNDTTNVITSTCHGLAVDDRVAFGVSNGELPCGIIASESYFVLAADLTTNSFKVSLTSGGSAVDFTIINANALYQVAKALDLTSITLDSDIRATYGGAVIASFVATKTSAVAGKINLGLTAATTGGLAAGTYVWDLKLTGSSTSFFYAKGVLTVLPTASRA